jgi:hypothetical protein
MSIAGCLLRVVTSLARHDPHGGGLHAHVDPDDIDHQRVRPDRIIPWRRRRRLVQPPDRLELVVVQAMRMAHSVRLHPAQEAYWGVSSRDHAGSARAPASTPARRVVANAPAWR